MATQQVGSLIISLEARTAQIQQDMAQTKRIVGDALGDVRKEAARTADALESTADSVKTLAGIGVGAAIIQGLELAADAAYDFISEVISAQRETAKLERTLIMANGGNLTLVARDMAYLAQTSDDLGVRLKLLGAEYASFMAVASRTNMEGKAARDVFEGFATAASAKELTMEEFHGALLSITQMMGKGRVASEELYGQLAERLPEAAAMAAESMGMTTQQFRKALEDGEVMASDLLPRLAWMLKNEMGAAAADAAAGVTGGMSQAATSVDNFYKAIAKGGAGDALGATFRGAAAVVDTVTGHLDEIVVGLQAIGVVAGASIAGRLASSFRESLAAQQGVASGAAQAARANVAAVAAEEQRAFSAGIVAEASKKAALSDLARAEAAQQVARQELALAAAESERLGLQAALAAGNARQVEAYRQQAAAAALVAESDAALAASRAALHQAELAREAQLIKTPETLRAVQQAQQAVSVAEADAVAAKALLRNAEGQLSAARGSAAAMSGAAAEAEARLKLARDADLAASSALTAAEARLVAMREAGVVSAAEYAVVSQRLVVAKEAEAMATTAAGMATRTASAALGLVGGPVGVAVIALTVLALNWDKVADRSVRAANMAEDSAARIKAALSGSNFAQAAEDLVQAEARLRQADEGMKKAIALRDSPTNTPQLRAHFQQQVSDWAAIADAARGVVNKSRADIDKARADQRKAALAVGDVSLEDAKLYSLGGTGRIGGKPLDTSSLQAELSAWQRTNQTKAAKRAEELAQQKAFFDADLISKEQYHQNIALIDKKYAEKGRGGRAAQYGSTEDRELADLRARIQTENQLAVALVDYGEAVDKITPGQKLLNELHEQEAVAKTAVAKAHIQAKITLAEELVQKEKANIQTKAGLRQAAEERKAFFADLNRDVEEYERAQMAAAQRLRDLYETPYQKVQRESAANLRDIDNNRLLSAPEQAQMRGAEVARAGQAKQQLQSGVRQDLGMVPDSERIIDAHRDMQRRIAEVTAAGTAERVAMEMAASRKLAQDAQALEMQKASLVLGMGQQVFDGMASLVEATAGRQSAAYKAMFLASRAASIAMAIVNTEEAATKALTLGPILGVPASTMVRALGYTSVGIMAAQAIQGMAHDGIDSIPREGTWLLDRGERVVDARTNADLKQYLQQKKGGDGGGITVVINDNVGVQVRATEGVGADGQAQLTLEIVERVADGVYTRNLMRDLRPGGVLRGG